MSNMYLYIEGAEGSGERWMGIVLGMEWWCEASAAMDSTLTCEGWWWRRKTQDLDAYLRQRTMQQLQA